MRVIPVIDLKGGLVVRGVAGDRSRYRPVVSVLAADPVRAASPWRLRMPWALSEVYVADLDAIAGREPDWAAYEQIAAAGLRLWVDAGIGEAGRARQMAHWAATRVPSAGLVVGFESWTIPRTAFDPCRAAPDGCMFSLDLRQRRTADPFARLAVGDAAGDCGPRRGRRVPPSAGP